MSLADQILVAKIDLALATGWTLDYIETLPASTIFSIFAVQDARNKASRKGT